MARAPQIGAASSAVHGRSSELAAIHALIAGARNGTSGALLIEGDPGVGKTTLLDTAVGGAGGVRVLRISGFEVEAGFPYAALQRLLAPLAGHAASIPDLQRAALRVAVGLGPGDPPQRALVGLGTLSLLSSAGDEQATICVVDDANYLDSESAEVLGFVARRLSAEHVALVFAGREDGPLQRTLAGVARLALSGLDPASAAAVLRDAVAAELDPSVVARIVEFTGGNPLALRELGDHWSAEELTSVGMAHEPVPIGRTLEDHYRARVESLPAESQTWLLVAAAESTGDASVVRLAADGLGVTPGASSAAEAGGLVEVRDAVRFRHPLVRSAVYARATDVERRRVHGVLQAVTAAGGQREVSAWHAAAAANGPSEEVAGRLAGLADLAAARGGLSSRAQLLARAAELTVDATIRHERVIGAAEAAIGSGAGLLAQQLLARLPADELDPVSRGRMFLVQAMCSLYLSDPAALRHGVATLLAAADEFRGVVPALEQRALLLAITFIQTTEAGTVGIDLPGLGQRMREGAASLESPYAVALRASSSFILDDYEVAVPLLREAVAMLEALDDRELLEFSYYCVSPTVGLWDADTASRLLQRTVRIGRETGALREVDAALWVLSAVELSRMHPRLAGDYLAQAEELRRALGYGDQQVVNAAYLAWQGVPRSAVEGLAQAMTDSGLGGVARMAIGALAENEIADGDYQAAFARLSGLAEQPFLQAGFAHLPELVEAAVRSGHRDRASRVASLVDRYADLAGTDRAAGLAHRCAALLADDASAERHYLASIAALDTPGHGGDCARTRLLYGEWLRRVRRRGEASKQLLAAWDAFGRVGATAFAERARRELKAAGAEPDQAARVAGDLTPQELEVARLAARGATNAEIGAALFISANTVDYHLRKVFRKLDVTSRRQLSEHMPSL
ncbi:MAG: LuxR C-terminal-related transcriptional regulator [Propionicimonas sp.]|nr:LuxR C-terminal-related transcriptional regulator [Propionicimonas sp.]